MKTCQVNCRPNKLFWPAFLFILAIIGAAAGLLSSPQRTVVTVPFTVEPVINYGIDIEDTGLFARYETRLPNRVYILGVFRGGGISGGEEVTHKINAEQLAALLSETGARRGSANVSEHRWSIYLWQNGDMHIMLGDDAAVLVTADTPMRSYRILDNGAIGAALKRMAGGAD
jgi:hypothetical protein